ncbi:hypothetical protein FHS23_003599 [Prauserella isguenensis]|uniref:Uncharacterized protein n=1 Tax=Prauserella isguenensis TaxID=1470180 RepID=A0A839S465_9PSEU|nr:hypothetical protein [Prauserella isguenensis]
MVPDRHPRRPPGRALARDDRPPPRHVGTLPGAAAGRPSSLTRDPEGSSSSS